MLDFLNDSIGISYNTEIMYKNSISRTSDCGETWWKSDITSNLGYPIRSISHSEDTYIMVGKYGFTKTYNPLESLWANVSSTQIFGDIQNVQFLDDNIAYLLALNTNGGLLFS